NVSSFFFQAEVGIRAFHVTGVQTCALPISISHCRRNPLPSSRLSARGDSPWRTAAGVTLLVGHLSSTAVSRNLSPSRQGQRMQRTEERRVGQEYDALGWLPVLLDQEARVTT